MHEGLLTVLPSLLDRSAVRQIVADSRFTAEERFLTTMAWGYGGVGYGPYRVGKMLSTPALDQMLTRSCSIASSGASLSAYEFLMNNRIRQLGPAFASKWLYFCGSEEFAAPIYDSVIAKWVMANAKEFFADVRISSEYWNPATYSRFIDFLNEASTITGCSRGELEYLIFLDQSA